MANDENGTRLDPRFRWLLGVLAFGLLVAGSVATFVTSNDVGAAALVAGGFGLAALAYLGDRITRLKYGEFEADMGAVKKAEALVHAASVAEDAGHPEQADRLRAEALETLNQLSSVGRSYEELRRSMRAGWQRTQLMESRVAEARRLAREKGVTVEQVRQLLSSGKEGDRLSALGAMEELPAARDFQVVLSLVADPRTPFEHYHALRVAADMVAELDEHEKHQLVDVIRRLHDPTLPSDSDRRILIERILRETEPSNGPR